MTVVLLNGACGPGDPASALCTEVERQLDARPMSVRSFHLAGYDLGHCMGEFDCFVKTPVRCRIHDEGQEIERAAHDAALVVLVTPMCKSLRPPNSFAARRWCMRPRSAVRTPTCSWSSGRCPGTACPPPACWRSSPSTPSGSGRARVRRGWSACCSPPGRHRMTGRGGCCSWRGDRADRGELRLAAARRRQRPDAIGHL